MARFVETMSGGIFTTPSASPCEEVPDLVRVRPPHLAAVLMPSGSPSAEDPPQGARAPRDLHVARWKGRNAHVAHVAHVIHIMLFMLSMFFMLFMLFMWFYC